MTPQTFDSRLTPWYGLRHEKQGHKIRRVKLNIPKIVPHSCGTLNHMEPPLLPTAPSLRLKFSLVWYFTRRSSVLLCVCCLRQTRAVFVQRMYQLAQVKVLLNFSLFSDSNFHSFVKDRKKPLLLYDILLIRLANCCMLSKKKTHRMP